MLTFDGVGLFPPEGMITHADNPVGHSPIPRAALALSLLHVSPVLHGAMLTIVSQCQCSVVFPDLASAAVSLFLFISCMHSIQQCARASAFNSIVRSWFEL